MRRLFLLLPALGALGCLDTTGPTRTPIDCETLATSIPAAQSSLITTADGLQYRDVTVGTGPQVVTGTYVAFHYSGCLAGTGTKFDENTTGDPAAVLQVGNGGIVGFNEGVLGMQVGGRRQLVIPPALAYGTAGAVDQYGNVVIPPNTTVVFTIDLIGIQ